MKVAMLIEQLQKMPPDAEAVWYNSEYNQFQKVNAIAPVEIGVRFNDSDEGEKFAIWEHHFKDDPRQKIYFTAVEVNTYLEQH